MGVQDNPKCVGGWIIGGFMGAANLIERLAAEGYQFSADEQSRVREYAYRMLQAVGDQLPLPVTPGYTVSPDTPDRPLTPRDISEEETADFSDAS